MESEHLVTLFNGKSCSGKREHLLPARAAEGPAASTVSPSRSVAADDEASPTVLPTRLAMTVQVAFVALRSAAFRNVSFCW